MPQIAKNSILGGAGMTENNKKHFYMRLKENSFDSDEMRILDALLPDKEKMF